MAEREAELDPVDGLELAHDPGIRRLAAVEDQPPGFEPGADVVEIAAQQHRRQGRGHGQGDDQRGEHRHDVGNAHRREDAPFDAAQLE